MRVNKAKVVLLVVSVMLFLQNIYLVSGTSANSKVDMHMISQSDKKSIDEFIKEEMDSAKIPGLSLVVVSNGETVYQKGFGYSDLKKKIEVTPQTLFELGSTSKAFTALGILQLEDKGLVKLSDSVKKYLPWFRVKFSGAYRGKVFENADVNITLEQLLHHTSGIPFETIGDIPVDDSKQAIEKTIKMQVGTKLDSYPGERYKYATLNYDILGLIIEKVTGLQFEEYMKQYVTEPLGLNSTFVGRSNNVLNDMAMGYKLGFLRPAQYNSPVYRGNTPAGYFISNAVDMARWLKIQTGTEKPAGFDLGLIEKSHLPDRTVFPGSDGASYAAGWSVFQSGQGEISHIGSNPNYSSYIGFRNGEKLGVAVLANLNSSYTQTIGKGIIDILQGKMPEKSSDDIYMSLDNASFTAICIVIPVIIVTIVFILITLMQILKRQRKYIGSLKGNLFKIVALSAFLACAAYCIYSIPDVLFNGLSWEFVKVWGPDSFWFAVVLLLVAVFLFELYFFIESIYEKSGDNSLFLVSVLSVVSGLGNAIIIFIINEALIDTSKFQSGLLLFFTMGILIYILGQRSLRARLITLTNAAVFQKREMLINSLLATPYHIFEKIENGKVHAGLNNDTDAMSNFINTAITGITGLITLICCFIYLGVINIWGLLVSVIAIVIAAGLYFIAGKSAGKLLEQTRDIQNVFFKFINELLGGFKELSVNIKKRNEFKNDMLVQCESYRIKKTRGDMKFANVYVVGELMFTFVIGVTTFVFPMLFKDFESSDLRNYVFVFLYMTGPVRWVLASIPEIVKVRISWGRLNELLGLLESYNESSDLEKVRLSSDKPLQIDLKDVVYKFKNVEECFGVGPINLNFKSGQITFITGGNGSGKSTLAKLLTGLYPPDSGEVLINGTKISPDELGNCYSVIFSDLYLFEKIYGVDYEKKKEEIEKYLKILCIDDKLKVVDGKFSTTRLSTGQKKRMALLISYLEDKPICIFDEWAADQDPEFRRIFYENLLPELRDSGKCIIAITHDDRYFAMADKVVKMELGMVVEGRENDQKESMYANW